EVERTASRHREPTDRVTRGEPIRGGESMTSQARIEAFFDGATHTVSYLVSDPASGTAAVIDPVLDYDHAGGTVRTDSADRILAAADRDGLSIAWLLETHVHADHLSAACYLKRHTGAPVAIGEPTDRESRVQGTRSALGGRGRL